MSTMVGTVPSPVRHRSRRFFLLASILFCISALSGCVIQSPNPFNKFSAPLKEFPLYGSGPDKILVISIKGVISDTGKDALFISEPSMVQEIVSQLRMAERDKKVRAVILKVDSPGGTTTASDILYNELLSFKRRTGKKIIVMMMGIATSGGYYVSLPADYIMAHPTTVTGSVGVIFMRPIAYELMDKIGVSVDIVKSGSKKDMGTPFRLPTQDEKDIFQQVTSDLGKRFVSLVQLHRQLSEDAKQEVASARIFLAEEAKNIGLIDQIGYLADAVSQARNMADLPFDAKIVVYRRSSHFNDNLYNTATSKLPGEGISLINVGFLNELKTLETGFFYLWTPGASVSD